MLISVDNFNIWIEINPNDLGDSKFILDFKPTQYGSTGTKYKIPLTYTALKNVMDYLPNLKQDLNFQKILIQLQLISFSNTKDLQTSQDPQLRPYQYQGLIWANSTLNKLGGAGFFWAMRTGKTRATCKTTKQYKKIIVLSLAGQELNWESTYKDMCENPVIINLRKYNTPKQRQLAYNKFNSNDKVILIGSVNTLTSDMLSGLFPLTKRYDMLIVDEAHKIKNPKTNLRQGANALRKLANHCLVLTGTPVSKHANEIAKIISFIHPIEYPKTYIEDYFFEKEASNWFNQYGVGELKKGKAQEWYEFLSLHFNQVNKEQALPWAKEPIINEVKLAMEDKQKDLYENLQFNFELPQGEETLQVQEVIAQMTKLKQLGLHPKLLNLQAPSIKEEWLVDFLNDYFNKDNENNENGVIVFSTFTSYLKDFYERFKNKYRMCLITGETKDKTEIANKFQNGEYDIVLANIQAGSKGITLDKADTIIFLDEDWRPDENLQAIERFTATTPDRIKPREVYRLCIDWSYCEGALNILSMDRYIRLVNENKINQTEVVNNFKDLYNKMNK